MSCQSIKVETQSFLKPFSSDINHSIESPPRRRQGPRGDRLRTADTDPEAIPRHLPLWNWRRRANPYGEVVPGAVAGRCRGLSKGRVVIDIYYPTYRFEVNAHE